MPAALGTTLRWGARALAATILAACGTTQPPPDPTPDPPSGPELMERTLTTPTGWWFLSNASEQTLQARIDAGFRLVDVEVLSTDPWRFAAAFVEDKGAYAKDWWFYYGDFVTAEELALLVDGHDARIIDLETYLIDGQRRYAAILVPNSGDDFVTAWWYLGADIDTLVAAVNANDARVIDIDAYESGGETVFNAVMYENTGANAMDWWWYFGASIDALVDAVNLHEARVVALERLADDVYVAIMVENEGKGWRWFFGATAEQVGQLANLYSVRLIDVEAYTTDDGPRFDVVLLQNGFHCDVVEGPQPPPPHASAAIDAALQAEMCAQGLIGLAAAVVRDGVIVYINGFGHEVAEDRTPVASRETMFRWASVSKTVTGLAGAQTALLDGVNLDANIAPLVPEYVLPNRFTVNLNEGDDPADDDWQSTTLPDAAFISLRMLLSNTSGIKHYGNGLSAAGTPPATERNDPTVHTDIFWPGPFFWEDPDHLVALPGTQYDYSSYGFNLAGMAIARAGTAMPMTYWEKVRDRIAVPFGMTPSAAALPDYPPAGFVSGTFFQPDHEWVEIPRRAAGYRLETVQDGDDTVETGAILPSGSNDVSWKAPAGGFISPVADMARFCNGLLFNPIVTDPMRTLMWSPTPLAGGGTSDYGLGFSIGTRNGRTLVSHSGAQQKAKTHMYIYPDDGHCFVVMSNSEWASSSALVQALEDAYRAAFP
jgi:CubicO group peptidase (beta-lactamase class C family)